MADAKLPETTLRTILAALSRDRLSEITEAHGLEVSDRRAHAAHTEAILGAAGIDFGKELQRLSRDELKTVCAALRLDTGGREKNLLVNRILALPESAAPNGEKLTLTAQVPTPSTPKPRSLNLKVRQERIPSSQPADSTPAADYRHDATRKNNPPAGLIDLDKPPPQPTKSYAYDPHLDPTLHWSGKAEHISFKVDTVSLHIHERVSTQAILRAVKRVEPQMDLFAVTELPESKAIDFYQHDVGWANRLVLGDSLLVMNSLLEREQMAGKVQCIYMDPPYGVKFNSNFQPSISRRDVKDGDDGSLTREPEQIQAYRDTWTLGIHSYLTYLRDRLLLARDLLAASGSLFVQISDENVHHVRELLDEVFGPEQRIATITFSKTTSQTNDALPATADYLLWYARQRESLKYRRLYSTKAGGDAGAGVYSWLRLSDGSTRRMTAEERHDPTLVPPGSRIFRLDNITSQSVGREKGLGAASWFPVRIGGKEYLPNAQSRWKTNEEGMQRLLAAGRVVPSGISLAYIRYLDDFPVQPFSNVWTDTGTGSFTEDKVYVVQTGLKVVQRCLLMTTDPGDLVFDPTCGSGTTACLAEHWGRRWITCDTSRVALALARQRLLTAKFPFYRLRSDRVKDGFAYKTVPHITLKSIAQNPKLDACKDLEGRENLIRASADQEVLYDQPEEDKSKVRVSGPFTVEAIPVATMEDPTESPIPQLEPQAREDGIEYPGRGGGRVPDAGGDFVAYMIDLLKKNGGVHFKNGKNLPLTSIRPIKTPHEYLHAESETGIEGDPRTVAISFGPRHGPVTPTQVRDAIQQTRGYDIVLFVGFACDPEAGRMIEMGAARRELHFVHAAPDILVQDLLKTSRATKLFTVFGLPDVKVHKEEGGHVSVELTGIDLYDPTTGETKHDEGESVAAWFLDHNYDGRSFLICQAFFPAGGTKNPWEKLQKALKGSIDEEKFETLRGTRSIPFKPGKKLAVKVIDDRGNEVVKVIEVGR